MCTQGASHRVGWEGGMLSARVAHGPAGGSVDEVFPVACGRASMEFMTQLVGSASL